MRTHSEVFHTECSMAKILDPQILRDENIGIRSPIIKIEWLLRLCVSSPWLSLILKNQQQRFISASVHTVILCGTVVVSHTPLLHLAPSFFLTNTPTHSYLMALSCHIFLHTHYLYITDITSSSPNKESLQTLLGSSSGINGRPAVT